MKLAARFIFSSFLVFVFCLLVIKPVAFAQTPTQNLQINSYATPNNNPDVPSNLHTWTQNVLIEVMSAMTCQLAGIDPTNPSAKCLGVDKKTGKIGFVENGGGAIGAMGGLITMTLNPPIHTRDYIAYLSNNFGLAKPTYAAPQDGFNSLSPMLNIWVVFRNIAYLLFVIVFIVIGLGIMLRLKIDPRTVMTIQNQIPKIIIGLLLVTFSFAIAGFLIDIMWVVIYLIINTLVAADPKMAAGAAGDLTSQLNTSALNFANHTYDGGLLGVIVNGAASFGSIIVNIFTGSGMVTTNAAGSVSELITSPVGGLVGAIVGWIFGFIGGIIAFVIILVAVLYSMLKLWFALLEAYIFTLVDVIFAPFWIISGLLPGGGEKMGFSSWMKDMLGNLSAFPATIMMFLIGRILIDAFGSSYTVGQFNPPLIGNPASGGTNVFGAIIALAIIWTTPHVVKLTKAAFKAPKLDLGPIGAAVGVGAAVPGRIISSGANTMFRPHLDRDTGHTVYPGGPLGNFAHAIGFLK